MSDHTNQERVWIARSLHVRIKALKRRTGKPMLKITNDLIRDGLKIDSKMRWIKREIEARRKRKARRAGR